MPHILIALASVLSLAQPAPAQTPAETPAQTAAPCELHITGAANITHPYVRRTMDMRAPVRDPGLASYEQAQGGFVLHPTVRAARLDPAPFARLFPPGRAVTVTLHEQVVDERPFARSEVRLYPSGAACYADLVVSNLYSVFPDFGQARERMGPLAGIVGGNRVNMTFRYHFFDAGRRRPLRLKESVDVPVEFDLEGTRTLAAADLAASLKRATDRAFALFLERHRRNLPGN